MAAAAFALARRYCSRPMAERSVRAVRRSEKTSVMVNRSLSRVLRRLVHVRTKRTLRGDDLFSGVLCARARCSHRKFPFIKKIANAARAMSLSMSALPKSYSVNQTVVYPAMLGPSGLNGRAREARSLDLWAAWAQPISPARLEAARIEQARIEQRSQAEQKARDGCSSWISSMYPGKAKPARCGPSYARAGGQAIVRRCSITAGHACAFCMAFIPRSTFPSLPSARRQIRVPGSAVRSVPGHGRL